MVSELFKDAQPAPQMQQIRPRDGGDVRLYSPNRDFAYVGPALIRQAFEGLAPPVPASATYGELLSGLPVEQQQQLGDFARTLATLIATAARKQMTLVEVAAELQAAGDPGMAACWQVKTAVLARLGEMCLGCIFAGLQDITPAHGTPVNRSIESLVAAAEKLATLVRVPLE